MPYITIRVSPRSYAHQITLEEIIMGAVDMSRFYEQPTKHGGSLTRTYFRPDEKMPLKILKSVDVDEIIEKLKSFVSAHQDLYKVADRHELYHTFKIPKRSGGLRTINAPNDELMGALRELKTIFEQDCKALYHASAFAYIAGRSTLDCVKKHQANKSKWFLKTDFSDFFGSTTKEFILKQMALIFPFNMVLGYEDGRNALDTALDLCMLDGGLPQGTPISPMLTNLMMIPIDAQLNKSLTKDHFVYSRYADDIQISCQHDFPYTSLVKRIDDCLASFDAPFKIKPTKTHYGSSAGQNWNLGVMLNKDNNITIGWRNTQRFNAMCSSFIMDELHGRRWAVEDLAHFKGLISYYKMVEEEKINSIIGHYNTKYGVDMMKMLKRAMKGE